MIIAGVSLILLNMSLNEVHLGYSSKDKYVSFELDSDFVGPVFLYYELSGFWGNYRTFVESKDDFVFSSTFAKYNCEASKFQEDVGMVRPGDGDFARLVARSDAGQSNEGTVLRPCGMVALTFFMDEYKLIYESRDHAVISLDQSDLSWLSDDDVLREKLVTS